MKTFVTTKIVQAEPQDKEGVPGFRVVYPDGYVSWCPTDTFHRTSRELNELEMALIQQEG